MRLCIYDPIADNFRLSYAQTMRTRALVALGCAFWLLPLAMVVRDIERYGIDKIGSGFPYVEMQVLIVPFLMIALTLLLGRRAKLGRLRRREIVTSSLVSVIACFCIFAFLARGT